jgi:hypothetical protein
MASGVLSAMQMGNPWQVADVFENCLWRVILTGLICLLSILL